MKQLTENQKLFLEVLFNEAEGDPVEAKRLAGYSDNYSTRTIMETLKEEIVEEIKNFLSSKASIKAVYSLYNVMQKPATLGAREIISAAKDVLDRANFGKVEKMEVKSSGPLFILPAKKEVTDAEEED